MLSKLTCLVILISTMILSCTNINESKDLSTEAINQINEAEKAFAQMAAEKGIAEAFWFYADSNATIKRQNDSLIHGKDNIRHYYSAPFYTIAKVSWSPDFTNASGDGEMGYTYGKYVWQVADSTGKTISESKGVFHTVWKKQADGSWKYVWD